MKLTPKALELLSRILKTAHLGGKPLPPHVRNAIADMLMTGRPLGRIVEPDVYECCEYFRIHAVNYVADEGTAPHDAVNNVWGMAWRPDVYTDLCNYLTKLEHEAQNI